MRRAKVLPLLFLMSLNLAHAGTETLCRWLPLPATMTASAAGGIVTVDLIADPSFFEPAHAEEFLANCPVQTESSAGWISATGPSALTEEGVLRLQFSVLPNAAAVRTAMIKVGSAEALHRFPPLDQEVRAVEVRQAAANVNGVEGRMAINNNGVVNAATFSPRISPGSLFTIFGTSMASGTVSGFSFPLPTSRNGTAVTVNGFAAPLIYLSATQINAQVPMEVAPGTATVSVNFNGALTSQQVSVTAAAPGLFQAATGRAIVQRPDGLLLGPSLPAQAGDNVVLYGTGIGTLTTSVATGAPAPGSPLARAALSSSLTIDGRNATISFIGLSPGFVGLMQINAVIPDGIATSDNVPVVLTINGVASTTLNMSVRGSGSPVGSAPVISFFDAQPQNITSGQSSTLSWNVSGATTVTIDNGVGAVGASGSRQVFPSSMTTYTLTASNAQGTQRSSTQVSVTASTPAPTILSFTTDSANLQAGQSTVLRWSTSNASAVSIDQGIGTVAASGSQSITPSSSRTYTLTASNSAGSRTAQTGVNVSAPSCTARGGAPQWNSDIVQFTGTLSNGGYQLSGFTVSATTTVRLRFVSNYNAQAAIITPDQVANFQRGSSFTGFALFDNKYGQLSATLGAGQYYVAARSFGATQNHMRYELDGTLQVPGASFVDYYVNDLYSVSGQGGYYVQPFVVQACFRYFLDGANSGFKFYLIPASEVENFKANRTFQYYKTYSNGNGEDDEDQPDDYELNLSPGDYALAYYNTQSNANTLHVLMSRWN